MMNETRTSSSRGTLQLTKRLRAGEPGSGVSVVPELRFVSSNDGGEGMSRSMGAGREACAATSTLLSGKKLGAGAGGPGSSDFLLLMLVLQPLDSLVNDTNVAYIERRVSKRTAENMEQRTLVGVGAVSEKPWENYNSASIIIEL